MKRCGYCGRRINTGQKFCCQECENNYEGKIQNDSQKIKYFVFGMVIGFVVMLYGTLTRNNAVTGTGIGLMGATVVIFPLTTPDTSSLLGYQRARTVGRILGILLAAVGAVLAAGSLADGCPGEEAEFEARVIQVNENSLLIEPSEGEEEFRSSDQISVSADDAGKLDLKEGDVIRVTYNGEIMETYPARLGEVYSIEAVTE